MSACGSFHANPALPGSLRRPRPAVPDQIDDAGWDFHGGDGLGGGVYVTADGPRSRCSAPASPGKEPRGARG
jgi:hypothetical protein